MNWKIDFLRENEGLISFHVKTKKFILNASLFPQPDLWQFGNNNYWKNSNIKEFGLGPLAHFSYIRL
jgi:hypothetical protein